ncbi:hypothetical protein O9993_03345 [Vibrio lentus]|nr:hypothetical protein [Vibrio lentus]
MVDWVKEAAVFNKDDRFYCSTTDGEESSPRQHHQTAPPMTTSNLTTLSYSNSAITKCNPSCLCSRISDDAGGA